MKKFLISIGNFVFRWRDTLFLIIFLPAFYLVRQPEHAMGGSPQVELTSSLIGFAVTFLGLFIRAATIGFGFVTRSGVNKRIHAQSIITDGIFAYVRNPLYLGNFLIVTGSIITINLFYYYVLALPLFYIFYIGITLAEEEYLTEQFGQEYLDYVQKVHNRFIPTDLSGLFSTLGKMEYSWKRYFKREYSSTVIITLGLLIVNLLKMLRFDWTIYDRTLIAMEMLAVVLIISVAITRYLSTRGKLEWN